jgi:hypothetical protein
VLFAKGEGMLRFSLEGKQPLIEQNWPKYLDYCKDELLNVLHS